MLILELYDEQNQEDYKKPPLNYDLKEDLLCFMHNDPHFYRKEYFPLMHKFKNALESGKAIHHRAFESICKKAYEQYKDKFKHVKGLEEDLEKDMCEDLCKELHKLESEQVKNGHYDD
jgi:hypothetical protein